MCVDHGGPSAGTHRAVLQPSQKTGSRSWPEDTEAYCPCCRLPPTEGHEGDRGDLPRTCSGSELGVYT